MLKYLGKVWKVITHIRTGLVNIIFLAIVVMLIVAAFEPSKTTIHDSAPLLVRISGTLVDKTTQEPSVVDLLDDSSPKKETLVRDITRAIKHAANDPRINALIFNLNGLKSANLSKLSEVGEAVEEFKTSGKPVIAFANHFSQPRYFLASYADSIYLNPMGNVAITGFGHFSPYFKDALDKLSINVNLFKVGNYKDAAEPFIRNDMSEASREHTSLWLNELWQHYTSAIEKHRDLAPGTIDDFIDNIEDKLEGSNHNFAQLSKEAGLIDEVLSRSELNKMLTEKYGKEEDSIFFKATLHQKYLADIDSQIQPATNNIGLIVASGAIVEGHGEQSNIGSESLNELIRQAADDSSLDALIIRIDSGGGSAFASELIRDEIINAKERGLAVYISMSSIAASGGYWIASAADEIWALPTTLTGSIGVWSLLPNFSNSMKSLGINNDGVGTTPLADIYHFDRPISPQAKQIFQSSVDSVYYEFINLVASARGQTPEEIHEIAQGRVWTGNKALELGLVDKLGSLDDLAAAISEKHQLDGYQIKVIKKPLSPTQEFVRALMQEASTFGKQVRVSILGPQISELIGSLPKTITEFKPHEGVQQIYAQCLTCPSL